MKLPSNTVCTAVVLAPVRPTRNTDHPWVGRIRARHPRCGVNISCEWLTRNVFASCACSIRHDCNGVPGTRCLRMLVAQASTDRCVMPTRTPSVWTPGRQQVKLLMLGSKRVKRTLVVMPILCGIRVVLTSFVHGPNLKHTHRQRDTCARRLLPFSSGRTQYVQQRRRLPLEHSSRSAAEFTCSASGFSAVPRATPSTLTLTYCRRAIIVVCFVLPRLSAHV